MLTVGGYAKKNKSMEGEILKIKFIDKYVSMAEDSLIYTRKLFSDDDFMSTKISKSNIHLIVEVKRLSSNNKSISVKILSYNSWDGGHFDYNQQLLKEKLNKIENIKFTDSDTTKILSLFNGGRVINNNYIKKVSPQIGKQGKVAVYDFEEKSIKEKVKFPIEKLQFYNGYVAFTGKIGTFKKPIYVEIKNDTITEEFDAVKNYISNILKRKTITANVDITHKGDKIISIKSQSDEIDKITPDIIKKVKINFFNNRINSDENIPIIKPLEDLLNKDTKVLLGEDQDIFFKNILEITDTKHYYHLLYLSDYHVSNKMKLRIISRSNYKSFLFFIKKTNYYYYVWETLNTKEATYIWSIPTTSNKELLISKLGKIEIIIKKILKNRNGKNEYINKKEKDFFRVFHDYKDEVNGLKKWKEELEKLMQ